MEIRFLSIIFLIAVSSNLKDISLNFTVDTYFIIKNGVIKNGDIIMKSFKKILASTLTVAAIATCLAVPASAARVSDSLDERFHYTVELKKPFLFGDTRGSSNFTFAVDYEWIREGINGSAYIRMRSDDWSFSDSKTARVAKGTNYAQTGDLKATGHRSGVHSYHNGSLCYRGASKLMMELPSEIHLSV